MKNIIIISLLSFSCLVYSQRKPKIQGNKEVVEVKKDLPPFNAIELNDDLEIFIEKAVSPGYTITADNNLIDILKFEVEDSTLVISAFYKVTAKKKLEITINYKELKSILLRDGKLTTKNIISSDELKINTLGYSKLDINATAPVMDVQMEGNSSGDFNVQSDSLTIDLKDKIDARIYSVTNKNVLTMADNAMARLEGTSDTLQLNLSGRCNLKAEMLEAKMIKATLTGSSSAKVQALQDFELSSKGSSKTYLYGNPKIAILEFLDTSDLQKESDW